MRKSAEHLIFFRHRMSQYAELHITKAQATENISGLSQIAFARLNGLLVKERYKCRMFVQPAWK